MCRHSGIHGITFITIKDNRPQRSDMMNHQKKVTAFASMRVLLCLMVQWLLVHVTAFQQNGKPLYYSSMIRSSVITSTCSFPQTSHRNKIHLLHMSSHVETTPEITTPSVRVDKSAIAKYFIALGIQVSLFGLSFYTVDSILHSLFQINARSIPKPCLWFLFYSISLKSRILNPLNNTRPKLSPTSDSAEKVKGFNDRIMPKWTPPGFIFPIVWLLLISPLRATASTMIIQAQSTFFTLPLMSLVLHLSIGDVWNTINNTERRYGTSVLGVVAVWLSAVHAAYQYYRISHVAGRLLGATCIWLTIAATLIGQTWRLNPSSVQGKKRDPFLPVIREGETSRTQFTWG